MKMLTAVCATLASANLLLAGCATPQSASSDDTKPQIVAGHYPLAWLAEQVAGEQAQVTSLAAPGQEPHDLELSVTQAAMLAQADLILTVEGLQPAVDDALGQASGTILHANDVVDMLSAEDHSLDEHSDEPAGEDADQHTAEAAEDEHAHGDSDPHFWLDPLLMTQYADAIAEELATQDPDNAETYRANAATVGETLRSLNAEFEEGLAACERDVVVVSHNAFAYFERYGLHFEAIAGLSPSAEPSVADLAILNELIKDEGVTTVFTETLVSPDLADTLAREAGVDTDILDPIEGLAEEGKGDYVSLMEANLAALTKANNC